MANLALFDFDGTITVADTFTPFIHYAVSPRRMLFGKVILAPFIAAYKTGFLHASVIRASVVRVGFAGTPADDIRHLGSCYAKEAIPKVIRQHALERIKWHKRRGDTVVIVSASLDVYLRDWCKAHDLDLICTELEVRSGIITGKYVDGDCTGAEKAKRVCNRYNLKKYDCIYAYGDTFEDEPMLNLAYKKFFRWQEVTDVRSAAAGAPGNDPNNAKRLVQIARENIELEKLITAQRSEL